MDPDALVQRITASVTANITQLLLRQRELDDALVWDQSVKLAADVRSSWPEILVQALQKCVSRASLFEEIASVFIDSILVHPSPLGPLPPLDRWPAPCLLTWEVEGSDFSPQDHGLQSLDSYLGEVNDPTYLQEQLNGWLRY